MSMRHLTDDHGYDLYAISCDANGPQCDGDPEAIQASTPDAADRYATTDGWTSAPGECGDRTEWTCPTCVTHPLTAADQHPVWQ